MIQTCATTSVKVAHFADVYNSLPLATPRPRFGLFGFQLRLFFFPFLLPFLGSSGVVFANMNTSALNELCEQESMKHMNLDQRSSHLLGTHSRIVKGEKHSVLEHCTFRHTILKIYLSPIIKVNFILYKKFKFYMIYW